MRKPPTGRRVRTPSSLRQFARDVKEAVFFPPTDTGAPRLRDYPVARTTSRGSALC